MNHVPLTSVPWALTFKHIAGWLHEELFQLPEGNRLGSLFFQQGTFTSQLKQMIKKIKNLENSYGRD